MRYIPTINAQHRYVHNTLQDSDRDLAIKDPIIFFPGRDPKSVQYIRILNHIDNIWKTYFLENS